MPNTTGNISGTVSFIGDGDTLTVQLDGQQQAEKVRLTLVDSPERSSPKEWRAAS